MDDLLSFSSITALVVVAFVSVLLWKFLTAERSVSSSQASQPAAPQTTQQATKFVVPPIRPLQQQQQPQNSVSSPDESPASTSNSDVSSSDSESDDEPTTTAATSTTTSTTTLNFNRTSPNPAQKFRLPALNFAVSQQAGSATEPSNDTHSTSSDSSDSPKAKKRQLADDDDANQLLTQQLLAGISTLSTPYTPPTTPNTPMNGGDEDDDDDGEPGPSPSICRRLHPALAAAAAKKKPVHLPELTVDLTEIREKFGGMPEDEQSRMLRLQACDSECSQICPGIYVSSYKVARSLQILRENGITHVMNLASAVCDNLFDSLPDRPLKYFTLELADGPTEDILCYLYDCFEFIDDALASGGSVLVHCWQGVSRSTTIVVAWLMLKQSLSFDEGLALVRKARNVARPNTGFMCQLLDWGLRKDKGPTKLMCYSVATVGSGSSEHVEAKLMRDVVAPSAQQLEQYNDTCLVFVSPTEMFVWEGQDCSADFAEKGKQHAQRLQTYEHAPPPVFVKQGAEPPELRALLPHLY